MANLIFGGQGCHIFAFSGVFAMVCPIWMKLWVVNNHAMGHEVKLLNLNGFPTSKATVVNTGKAQRHTS